MVALRPPFRADDMESLYRKILRGQYPRVPSVYSRDVSCFSFCYNQFIMIINIIDDDFDYCYSYLDSAILPPWKILVFKYYESLQQ